jgi:hypothetical protein
MIAQMAYQPVDVPKPVVDGIWLVDSVLGPGVPVRMTVIRLASGDLLLHSPTRYSQTLQTALEALGPIRHLVAPNTVHWVFVKPWRNAIPHAEVWAAPGLRDRGQVRRSGLIIDHDLSDTAPAAWAGEIDQIVVHGGLGFSEVVMLHRPTRTALFTDLVQNFETQKLPWFLRPIGRLLGNVAPTGRAPSHLRAVVGHRSRDAARRIVAWTPDRVLVTHGHPFEADASDKLRQSLAWLTR